MRTSYSGRWNAEREGRKTSGRGDKSDSGRELDIKTILKMQGHYIDAASLAKRTRTGTQ